MDRPLRILTFLHSFEPGGVERVALRLVTAWRAKGIDAPLLLGRDSGAMRREWPDIAYRSLAVEGLETGWFETLWMILCLPAQIRQIRPDILFCAGNSYAIVAVVMKLVLGKTCPPIIAKISNDLARTDMTPLMRWGYRSWLKLQGKTIDLLVGMAEPMRREIAEAMGVDARRVAIVNDPALCDSDVDAAIVMDATLPSEHVGTHYVAAGRLAAQKNFPLLLNAFATVAYRDDRLTIFGDGPDRSALIALAEQIGISDRLVMAGHVHPMIAALAKHDVFLLSSDYEGVPAVVIEALAAGLPIVATDCSVSMVSLLDGGALGELVPVRDASRLEYAMLAAHHRIQNRNAARAQARRFTVEAAASAYAALAASLIAGRDTGRNSSSDAVRHRPRRNVPQPTPIAVSAMHGTVRSDHRSGTAVG